MLIILIIFFSLSSFSKNKHCSGVYSHKVKQSSKELVVNQLSWVKTPHDAFMAFRSSIGHFVNTMLQSSPQYILDIKGTGMGDFSPQNIDLIELKNVNGNNKTRVIGANDLDDGVINYPILFDLIREFVAYKFIFTKIDTELQIPTATLMKAYQNGLNGVNLDFSKTFPNIAKKMSLPREDYLQLQAEFIAKQITKNKLNSKSKFEPITDSNKTVADFFKEHREFMESEIKKEFPNHQILDFGFRIKDTGGSRFQIRIGFLIESPSGEKQIVEFKELKKTPIDTLIPQPEIDIVFNSVSKLFRPAQETLETFKQLKNKNTYFLFRNKTESILGLNIEMIDPHLFDNSKLGAQNLKDTITLMNEFILLNLYYLGSVHREKGKENQISLLLNQNNLLENDAPRLSEFYYQMGLKLNQ